MALTAWTGRTAAQTAANAPVDVTLMDSLRLDLNHLRQTVYGDGAGGFYTAAEPHTHDGSNSVIAAEAATVSAGVISQSRLKTSTGEVSTLGTEELDLTLPGGTYGFWPQVRTNNVLGVVSARIAANVASTSYVTNIAMQNGSTSYTSYAQQRYVTASGKDHWIFLLWDFVNGGIGSGWQAPDHPSCGSCAAEHELPHPFGSFDESKYTVILVDNAILEEIKLKVTTKRSLLTIINEDYDVDFEQSPVYVEREIVEIDERGDKAGEVIAEIKTPQWAKIAIEAETIFLKRRVVKALPAGIEYRGLKLKIPSVSI